MKILPFIGREREIQLLQSVQEKSNKSRITALYGRRRVGKTRLVKEAFKKFNLFVFEGLEGEGSDAQKGHFLKILSRYSGSRAHNLARTKDWADILILLAEFIGKKKCVILLDEFQWMAAGRTELVSKLKYVWDNYFAEKGAVHLILCGSISSFLVKKVIKSKALYGRIEQIIELKPLSFQAVRKYH